MHLILLILLLVKENMTPPLYVSCLFLLGDGDAEEKSELNVMKGHFNNRELELFKKYLFWHPR